MLLMMSQGILKFLFAHNINISVKLHATALCRIRLVICHRALIRSDSSCYYQTRSTFTTRPHSTTSVQLAPRHRRPVCLSEAVVLTEVVIICIVIYAACRNYIFERVIIVVNSPVIDWLSYRRTCTRNWVCASKSAALINAIFNDDFILPIPTLHAGGGVKVVTNSMTKPTSNRSVT